MPVDKVKVRCWRAKKVVQEMRDERWATLTANFEGYYYRKHWLTRKMPERLSEEETRKAVIANMGGWYVLPDDLWLGEIKVAEKLLALCNLSTDGTIQLSGEDAIKLWPFLGDDYVDAND